MADAFGYAKQKQEYVMKILVVGGTGLIGGHAALHLQSLGHEVTIAARHSAQEQSALASLPILIGDYVANDFTREQLADFDALEIGRASCRERVWQVVYDSGVAGSL